MKLAPSRWFILLTGWTVFGALQALMPSIQRSQRAGAETLLPLLALHLPLAWLWAFATPLVGAWTRAVSARFSNGTLRIAAHMPLLLALALLHTALRRALLVLLGASPSVGFDTTLLFFADLTIVAYAIAVWASRLLDIDAALVRQERRAIQLRRQLATARLEYLGLQLRPHFLFNALGSVSELARDAPRGAARMLLNIVALLEAAVRVQGRELVTLGSELTSLQPYLEIQRVRFMDWLRIEVDASAEAREALIPPLMLQPLVENAVHHGLIRRSARGEITIRATIERDRLRVSVHDNGQGLSQQSREDRGLGLANVRERLDAVYGGTASLELRNVAQGGTEATILVPLRMEEKAAGDEAATQPEVAAAPPPSPWVQWMAARPVMSAVLAWSAVALLRIQHSYAYMLLRDRMSVEALWTAVRYDVAIAALWLLMTPLVLFVARAIRVRRGNVAGAVAAHVAIAGILAYLHAALIEIAVSDSAAFAWSAVSNEVYAWNVAVYGILVVAMHQRALERWLREREVAEDRLRRDVTEARFLQLSVELRPQVLIDALRRLADLVQLGAAETDRALTDIADFLRCSLDTIHESMVSLEEEARMVQAYARVLRIASAPALRLDLEMPASAGDVTVSNGALRRALESVLSRDMARVRMNVSADGDVRVHTTASVA